MKPNYEGNALVYCEGAYGTTNGKTANGLVRRSERYRIVAVIDSLMAGYDAGNLIDGVESGIPVVSSLQAALDLAEADGNTVSHFIIGLAPDGGRLPPSARRVVIDALMRGIHVVSGLHDFLSEDRELADLADRNNVDIIDVRRMSSDREPYFFSGKIEDVSSLRVAVLGTDSATGKRTTAWKIVDALRQRGTTAELIGTGQTAWLQGAEYSIVFDSLINDFVSGEIEHAVWSAWREKKPGVIVVEGQGSLMNPAYPGGFEILAAARPHCVVLQHVPGRVDYDGFPGYPIHPLRKQIQAIELISDKPVVAITVNLEGLRKTDPASVCRKIARETGLPTVNPLVDSMEPVLVAFNKYL